MNKSSESYKVYTEANPSGDGKASGVHSSQPEVGGQSYPGRPTPPASPVVDAKDNPGTAVNCAKKQTGDNRLPMNSHVKDHCQYGPNN